jgi:hypothetical protein
MDEKVKPPVVRCDDEIFYASPLETLDPQMIGYRSQKTFYDAISFI